MDNSIKDKSYKISNFFLSKSPKHMPYGGMLKTNQVVPARIEKIISDDQKAFFPSLNKDMTADQILDEYDNALRKAYENGGNINNMDQNTQIAKLEQMLLKPFEGGKLKRSKKSRKSKKSKKSRKSKKSKKSRKFRK